MIRAMLGDFRQGLRRIASSPWVSATAIAALALGIGANTAIFSVVFNVLLRPLPIEDPSRLVVFSHYFEKRNINSTATPYPDAAEWRSHMTSFQAIAAVQGASMSLSTGGDPERVQVFRANANFLPMLGVRPVLGRGFASEEDRPGGGRVAILSYGLWSRRFGANPSVAGARFTLDGDDYTVVGVLPESFRFTGPAIDAIVPLAANEARGAGRPAVVTVYGRIKKDATSGQVQRDLDQADAEVDRIVPAHRDFKIRTGPVADWIVPDVKVSLWVLLGAVGLVLLIACANVANLLLARAAGRRREMAVRAALGAGRGRLIAQLMAESAPLGVVGAGIGLLIAFWAVHLLALFPIDRIPRLAETRIDLTVLGFTAGVSLVTCLLFALAPALSLSRTDVHEMLKEGGRTGSGVRGSRVRSVLVACEMALALMLSIGAVLMIRTFQKVSTVDAGLNPRGLLTGSIEIPRHKVKSKEQATGFYRDIAERLTAMPGVRSVSFTNSLPLGGSYFRGSFGVEGRHYSSDNDMPVANMRVVDDRYLNTMQIALKRGRGFTAEDRDGSPMVALINETTARRFFQDEDPIGRRLIYGKDRPTVVGIIADIRHTDVTQESGTEILLAFAQSPALSAAVSVRLDPGMYSDPMRFSPLLTRTVASVDKDQSVSRITSMEQLMSNRLAPRRLSMVLLISFAALALLLASIGIYGVMSFAVEQRTREIGIRVALGAQSGNVVAMVVRHATLVSAAGIVLGVAGAAALTRLLGALLYGVSPTEPLAFACTAALLLGVAALAGYLPAKRATRVDPVIALRYE